MKNRTDLEWVSIYSVLRHLTNPSRLRYDDEREADLRDANRIAKEVGFDDVDSALDFLQTKTTVKDLRRAEYKTQYPSRELTYVSHDDAAYLNEENPFGKQSGHSARCQCEICQQKRFGKLL